MSCGRPISRSSGSPPGSSSTSIGRAVVAQQRQRPGRPCPVRAHPSIRIRGRGDRGLMGDGCSAAGRTTSTGVPVAVVAHAPPSAEEALTVLRQNLTIAIRIRAAQRARRGPSHGRTTKLHSAAKPLDATRPRFLRAYPRSEGSKNGSKWHATDGTNRMDRCVQRHLRRADHARAHASRYLDPPTPNAIGADNRVYPSIYPRISPGGRCASAGFVHWHKADR